MSRVRRRGRRDPLLFLCVERADSRAAGAGYREEVFMGRATAVWKGIIILIKILVVEKGEIL